MDDFFCPSDDAIKRHEARQKDNKRHREYRKNHRDSVLREQQRWKDNYASQRQLKDFVSLDGEGAPDRPDAGYVHVSAGDITLTESSPGKGLSWDECLNWLCHLPKEKEYVAFAFDYDVAMMLRGYSVYQSGWATLERIGNNGGLPVLLKKDANTAWYVSYLPKMHFKVMPARRCPKKTTGWCTAHKECKTCGRGPDPERGHYIKMTDTIKLFQTSLMKVIDDWEIGTPEERERLKKGKDNREFISYLDPEERTETDEYNAMEVRFHAEVMTKFRKYWIEDAGLPQPKSWSSPGYLAKRILAHYKVPTRRELDELANTPDDVQKIAELSYIAGWFEVSCFGPVGIGSLPIYSLTHHKYYSPPIQKYARGLPVTEYDLSSAYPYAMTKLPCLRHSHWEHRAPRDDENGLILVSATWDGPIKDGMPDDTVCEDFPMFMGLPHRDKHGRVSRPLHTTGWYWNFEVAQARHQTIKVRDGWTWIADGCNCDMWSFIPKLFAKRQELGKLKGRPLKLALNALYGVMAQRQRGESVPEYLNYVVASFITAQTRTTLMRTIHENSCEIGLRCGSDVVMIATDAIFFLDDPQLPGAWDVSEKEKAQLGDWTREQYPKGLFIVQGGVYWPIGAEKFKSKSRGFPASILQEHIEDFRTVYESLCEHYHKCKCDPETAEAHPELHGRVILKRRRTPDGRVTNAMRFTGLREMSWRCKQIRDADDRRQKNSEIPISQRLIKSAEAVKKLSNARQNFGRFTSFERSMTFDWESKRKLWRMGGKYRAITTLPKEVEDPVSQPYKPLPFFGRFVPELISEENILNLLDDSPEWLPVMRAPVEDEGFPFHE